MKLVEVTQDTLGWLLVYSRAHGEFREGDPVGAPDYYGTRRAANEAAKAINAGTVKLPSKIRKRA